MSSKDPKVFIRLRYELAVSKAGRDALASVFMWSYRGSFPVMTYLTHNLGYTNAKKKIFYEHELDKLKASSDAANFDITLLYKLLQRVCGLAKNNGPTLTTPAPRGPSLEHLIYKLKQHRNALAHDKVIMTVEVLRTTLTELRDLMTQMLAEAGNKCMINRQDVHQASRDATVYIDGLWEKIREPLDSSDNAYLDQLHQEIKVFKSQITEEVKQKSKLELTDGYKLLYQIVPAPWLDLNIHYNPSLAFTALRLLKDPVIGSRPSHTPKVQDIDYKDILSIRREDGSVPQCVLLTGEGGMGKTTFLKFILEKWVEEDPLAISHLDSVDLVFYVQCRDRHLNNFDKLLLQLLRQTFNDSHVDFKLFKEIILSLNILVLIDGYDEVNDHSGSLVEELLHLPGKDVRLVITTRPGWDKDLSQLVPLTKPRYNILVLGVSPEHRMEYAEKIINVLVEKENQRSVYKERFTQRLEQMSEFLGEYLNTPLTLTLLALLCVEAPQDFDNLNTNTQVYEEIHDFITRKLESRLTVKQVNDPKRKCKKFVLLFEEVCLRGIKRKEYDLLQETEEEIRDKCDTLGLPQEEVLSTYFTRTRYRRGLKEVCVFGYFHARYQEHCAARGLVAQLLKAEEERGDQASHGVSGKSSGIIDSLRDVVPEQVARTLDSVEHFRRRSILLSITGVLSAQRKEHRFVSQVIALACKCHNISLEDDLLKHVAESRKSKHVIRAVCERLPRKHSWSIMSVDSCVVLPLVLKTVTPKVISLHFDDTPQSKQLLSALSMLAKMEVTIHLQFSETYHNIKKNNDLSDNFLEILTSPGSSCILKNFQGRLSGEAIPRLPHTLEFLALSLTLQHLPIFITHLPHLHQLQRLHITLDATTNMDPATLLSLPYQGSSLLLRISRSLNDDDPDIDWCCHLAAQLCPPSRGGYDNLDFHDTHLTSVGGEKLMRGLHQRGVTGDVLWLDIEDSVNSKEKMKYLRELCASLNNFKKLILY